MWLGGGALAASIALGLPSRLLTCALEWPERDYGNVSAFVQAHIRPDDRVATDQSAYYPVMQISHEWYLNSFLGDMPRADLEAITCIIDRPESAGWVMEQLGGAWQMTAEYRAEPPAGRPRLGRALLYHLAVYRRVPRAG